MNLARLTSSAPGPAFWVFLIAVALSYGALCGIFPLGAVLLGAALVFGAVGMAVPLHWMISLELLLGAIVAGSIEYFLGFAQAHWIPFLLGLLLGLRALIERPPLATRLAHRHTGFNALGNDPALFWYPAAVYLFAMLATVVINLPPLGQVLVAMKNYVFLWGVLLAYLGTRAFDSASRATWTVVILAAVVQLPVVLYQKVFVASRLSNAGGAAGLSWDAISGTFGGGLLGGHSATMAFFVTIALTYSLVRWLERRWSLWRLLFIAAFTIPSLFLAEVKAVLVWLAIAGLLVFVRRIGSRPLLFLAGCATLSVLLVSIVLAYKSMYYEGSRTISIDELWEKQVYYVFEPNKFNTQTREMGRAASVVFWWRQHDASEPAEMLLGHGLGASRGISTFAVGEVARKFWFFIDTSSMTTLLWDTGAIGFLSFVAMLSLGAFQAFRLASTNYLTDDTRLQVEVAAIGLVLILSAVPYNRDAIDNAAMQCLMFFFLALVVRAKWSMTDARRQ